MTDQNDLFPPTGESLRDECMERVLNNSGFWKVLAQEAGSLYVSRLSTGTRFTGEDVRLHGLSQIGRPHHHNAYGPVIGVVLRRAMKAGLIKRHGLLKAIDPKAHARQYPAYIRI